MSHRGPNQEAALVSMLLLHVEIRVFLQIKIPF